MKGESEIEITEHVWTNTGDTKRRTKQAYENISVFVRDERGYQ